MLLELEKELAVDLKCLRLAHRPVLSSLLVFILPKNSGV